MHSYTRLACGLHVIHLQVVRGLQEGVVNIIGSLRLPGLAAATAQPSPICRHVETVCSLLQVPHGRSFTIE